MARSTPVARDTVLINKTDGGSTNTIAIGSPDWFEWLEDEAHRSFAFDSPLGAFTARKERKQRGGWYWTAYRQVAGKLRKSYLGKSAELSLQRLHDGAAALANRGGERRVYNTGLPLTEPVTLPPQSSPILQTKLFVPPASTERVSRPRLTARLTEGLAGQLTLLSAPPGFGKTTLLAEWLPTCTRRVAWLSLEASDNEPLHLLRYLVAALQTIAPDVGWTTLALLQMPQPPAPEPLLTFLINDLVTYLPPAILVLDDYHVLHGSAVHQSINFLLEHLPPQLHVVVATREDPPLPLPRLRTRRQLNELRATDLRFTSEETALFLNNVLGLSLTDADIVALEQQTEGWVAGLQLAALSLRDHADSAAFIAEFTGSHRYVFDYLVEEVFKRQPETVKTFLLATSILDRFCGDLCDAVLGLHQTAGRKDAGMPPPAPFSALELLSSQAMLEQLEHANLFLIPLDGERRWYRYHHLFADLLQVRLRQTWPLLLPELHRRASAWLADAGWMVEAVRHLLAIPDHDEAARLIAQNAELMVVRGEFITLHHWFEVLPASVYPSNPHLLLMRAWTQFLVEPYGKSAVEALLSQTEEIIRAAPLPQAAQLELWGIVAAIRSAVAGNQEKRQQAIGFAEEALALLPIDNVFWRLIPTINLGLAYDAGGAVAAASTRFAEALDIARRTGIPYMVLIATIHLGRVRAEQGQLHEAVRLYREALAQAAEYRWDRLPMVGLPHVWLAKVLYEWNDLTGALQHVTAGMQPVQFNEHRRILLEAYGTLARIKQAQGDLTAAQTALARAVEVAAVDAMQWAAPRVAAYQARARLPEGDLEQAERWLHTAQLHLGDELDSQREYEHITLARVLIALGRPEQAFPFLQRLAVAAEEAGRLRSLIEILLLSVRAHDAQGEMRVSLDLLARALVLAEPEGYVRSFVDEGPRMADLLKQVTLRNERMRAYRDRVLAAFTNTRPSAPVNPAPSGPLPQWVEPLSPREREALQLIAAGLSNTEIAQQLVIALSTVKRHVHNICAKLDAHSRTAVLARARSYNLL